MMMTVTDMTMAIRNMSMPIRRAITATTATGTGIAVTVGIVTGIGIVTGMMIGATTVEIIAAIAGIETD